MKKIIGLAPVLGAVSSALAQESSSTDPGLQFVSDAATSIGAYNAPIVALLTACFAIVMIFVGYKIAKRSVAKA